MTSNDILQSGYRTVEKKRRGEATATYAQREIEASSRENRGRQESMETTNKNLKHGRAEVTLRLTAKIYGWK